MFKRGLKPYWDLILVWLGGPVFTRPIFRQIYMFSDTFLIKAFPIYFFIFLKLILIENWLKSEIVLWYFLQIFPEGRNYKINEFNILWFPPLSKLRCSWKEDTHCCPRRNKTGKVLIEASLYISLGVIKSLCL